MSDQLGARLHGRDIAEHRDYSEKVAEQIDDEILRLVQEATETARKIILANRDKMDDIVKVLLEKETIERQEFEILMKGPEAPVAPQAAPQPPLA